MCVVSDLSVDGLTCENSKLYCYILHCRNIGSLIRRWNTHQKSCCVYSIPPPLQHREDMLSVFHACAAGLTLSVDWKFA